MRADGGDVEVVTDDAFGSQLAVGHGFVAWSDQVTIGLCALAAPRAIRRADASRSLALATTPRGAVFASRADHERGDLAFLDAASGERRVVSTFDADVSAIAVAGDTAYVGVSRGDALYAVDLATGEARRLRIPDDGILALAVRGATTYAIATAEDSTAEVHTIESSGRGSVSARGEALEGARRMVVGPHAIYVATGSQVWSQGDREGSAGAAVHRVADGAIRTIHALEAPRADADFMALLGAGSIDGLAVVDPDTLVVLERHGRNVAVLALDADAPAVAPSTTQQKAAPVADPLGDLYAARLGPLDPLAPIVPRLLAGLSGVTLVQGRRGDAWYTATRGLARGRRDGFEIVLVHARREPWAPSLVATLVDVAQEHEDGEVLLLLDRHGGVTAGPFAFAKGREVGVLLLDGPPLLPESLEVDGARVRLLRAFTIAIDELRFANEKGARKLVTRLRPVLAASLSDPRRPSFL